jgi:hypothetical protein
MSRFLDPYQVLAGCIFLGLRSPRTAKLGLLAPVAGGMAPLETRLFMSAVGFLMVRLATVLVAPTVAMASVAIAIIGSVIAIAIIWASVAIAIIGVAITVIATAIVSTIMPSVVANLFNRGIAFR